MTKIPEDPPTFTENLSNFLEGARNWCYDTASFTTTVARKVLHPVEINIDIHAESLYRDSRRAVDKLNLPRDEGMGKFMIEAQNTELAYATSVTLGNLRKEKPIVWTLAALSNGIFSDWFIDGQKQQTILKQQSEDCNFHLCTKVNENIMPYVTTVNAELKRLSNYSSENAPYPLTVDHNECNKTARKIADQYMCRRAIQGGVFIGIGIPILTFGSFALIRSFQTR